MTAATPSRPLGPRQRGAILDKALRSLAIASTALAVVAILAPVLLTAALSFSNDSFYDFPPQSWGLRQYRAIFGEPPWGSALGLSLEIALAVVILSALIAVPAAFAIQRSRLPGRHAIYAGGLAGIIVPITALAVALYGVFSQLGLRGSYLGLVLAHTTLAVPVMLIAVTAALGRIPVDLELAAMTAGASRARAALGITGRLLLPAVMAGGVLAFVTSFDEAVLISFLGTAEQTTLAKAVLDAARFGASPVVTAVATLLIASTALLAVLVARLAGRRP